MGLRETSQKSPKQIARLIFRISRISAPLQELTFRPGFPESVRFSDIWNSGKISRRRVEIQQEFRNCCEEIPDRNSSTAVTTTRQACQRHGGGYISHLCVPFSLFLWPDLSLFVFAFSLFIVGDILSPNHTCVCIPSFVFFVSAQNCCKRITIFVI